MTVDLAALAKRVQHELETYEVPERHPELVGSALPQSWYDENLATMLAGLVAPYWADVIDYDEARQAFYTRKVVIVAKDNCENFLAYDPQPNENVWDNDFAMIGTQDDGLHVYNIRGDAVGTFLSF